MHGKKHVATGLKNEFWDYSLPDFTFQFKVHARYFNANPEEFHTKVFSFFFSFLFSSRKKEKTYL